MNTLILLPSHQVEREAPDAGSARLRHMAQLDGLRGLAVIMVLLQHAIPPFGKIFPVAHSGVILFFVLSGFLITSILLADRRDADSDGGRWMPRLGLFYMRRALRLMPIYILVVVLGLIFNVGVARSCWAWLLSYTTNFALVSRGAWIDAYFHFWTLAIEEQFYLLWPLVVLAAPRCVLGPLVVAMIAVGVLYRGLAVARHFSVIATYCPTPACLDSLGMGALIALAGSSDNSNGLSIARFFRGPAFWFGLTGVVLARVAVRFGFDWIDVVFLDLAQAVGFAGLVVLAAGGMPGWAGWLLDRNWLRSIGIVSYGIYVYHVFLPPFLMRLLALATGNPMALPDTGLKLLMLLSIFVVPVLSWYGIERPINRLRSRFRLPAPLFSAMSNVAVKPVGVATK